MSDTTSATIFQTLFQVLTVNGFVYRFQTTTGEMWRLEVDPKDKKTQVWKKIEDASAVMQ